MTRPAILSILLTAGAAMAAPADPAWGQPEEPGVERWGTIDLTVGSLEGSGDPGDDRTLFALLFSGGMMAGQTLGVGLLMPVVQTRGDLPTGTTFGNLTGELYWVLYQRLGGGGRWRARAWSSGSFSVATAAREGAGGAAAATVARFWVPDPGLFAPGVYTARGGLHGDVERGAFSARVDLRGDYLFGDADETRLLAAATGRLEIAPPFSLLVASTNVWRAETGAGEDSLLHAAKLGASFAAPAHGRIELSLYAPLDELARTGNAFGVILGLTSVF